MKIVGLTLEIRNCIEFSASYFVCQGKGREGKGGTEIKGWGREGGMEWAGSVPEHPSSS